MKRTKTWILGVWFNMGPGGPGWSISRETFEVCLVGHLSINGSFSSQAWITRGIQRSYHWDAQLLGTSSFRGRKNMLLILYFVICFDGDLHTQIWVWLLINQASLSTILPAQRSGICMIYVWLCMIMYVYVTSSAHEITDPGCSEISSHI